MEQVQGADTLTRWQKLQRVVGRVLPIADPVVERRMMPAKPAGSDQLQVYWQKTHASGRVTETKPHPPTFYLPSAEAELVHYRRSEDPVFVPAEQETPSAAAPAVVGPAEDDSV